MEMDSAADSGGCGSASKCMDDACGGWQSPAAARRGFRPSGFRRLLDLPAADRLASFCDGGSRCRWGSDGSGSATSASRQNDPAAVGKESPALNEAGLSVVSGHAVAGGSRHGFRRRHHADARSRSLAFAVRLTRKAPPAAPPKASGLASPWRPLEASSELQPKAPMIGMRIGRAFPQPP